MKWLRPASPLWVPAIGIVLLLGCGGDASPSNPGVGTPETSETSPGTMAIESPSGMVRLDIPDGALPSGLSAADIQITERPTDAPEVMTTDGPAVALARFEPAGLSFEQPVTVTLTVPAQEAIVPFWIVRSGDSLEALLPTVVSYDSLAGEATVIVELDHFSVVYQTNRFFLAGFELPAQATVAEPFDAVFDYRIRSRLESRSGLQRGTAGGGFFELEYINEDDLTPFASPLPMRVHLLVQRSSVEQT